MRATIWTLPIALFLLTFTPAPATADFHPVCTGFATAYANVELLSGYSEDGVLDYHGRVFCPDGDVTITLLQVYDASGAEPVLLDEVENTEPCLSSLTTGTCVLRGAIEADPGTYEVRMLFDVSDPHTDETEFPDVPRRAVFEYAGAGQPVPTCTSAGFFPIYVGC